MQDFEERFGNALHNTARAWRHTVDLRLKRLGLSQASWATLAFATAAHSPPSQSELADLLGIKGATMVAMVDRLVKAGLLARQTSKSDRRIKRVALTDAGNQVVDTANTDVAAVRKELLATIDPQKLSAATALLETLRHLIEDFR
jgi:MarR family transcriptional regulator for hemolysin